MYKKIIIKKDTEICVIIDQAIHIIFLSKQIKGEFFFRPLYSHFGIIGSHEIHSNESLPVRMRSLS